MSAGAGTGLRPGILAIDAGTTGTRAAIVDRDGRTHGLAYRRLDLHAAPGGIVEQDAEQIRDDTIVAARAALASAREHGIAPVAVAISAQRATTVLWDATTGRALGRAMSWQDTRNADRLAALGAAWDERLLASAGRTTGIRSPYLWSAQRMHDDEVVRDAAAAGRLRLGTVDAWLAWHLTGGRSHALTASMAAATGGYDLAGHAYLDDWLAELGTPRAALPPLADDVDDLGVTDPDLLGVAIPIRCAMGDQLAGAIGLGVTEPGQAMSLHGTGSFVDLLVGDTPPPTDGRASGTTTIVAARVGGRSRFAVETYAANTGSALEWLCRDLGLFDAPTDISRLAQRAGSAEGVFFLPSLTGLRSPDLPQARASLTGLTLATRPEHVAVAVIDGIAHTVAASARATAAAAGTELTGLVVGGGVSASDRFLQVQADLLGVPVSRPAEFATASLRGVAYLAGSDGLLWNDLDEAIATVALDARFEPQLGASDRDARLREWDAVVEAERLLAGFRSRATRATRATTDPHR